MIVAAWHARKREQMTRTSEASPPVSVYDRSPSSGSVVRTDLTRDAFFSATKGGPKTGKEKGARKARKWVTGRAQDTGWWSLKCGNALNEAGRTRLSGVRKCGPIG